MPPRVIQSKVDAASPEQMARMLTALGGFFDDPIAQIRATWGPLSTTRTLTLEVVDRKGDRYPPTAFRNAKGISPGRWLIGVYFSATEYGSALSPGITWDVGRSLGQYGSLVYIGCTDATGVAKLTVDKGAGGAFWAHHGVFALLRSTGIDWSTGGTPTGSAGDEKAKPGAGGSSSV